MANLKSIRGGGGEGKHKKPEMQEYKPFTKYKAKSFLLPVKRKDFYALRRVLFDGPKKSGDEEKVSQIFDRIVEEIKQIDIFSSIVVNVYAEVYPIKVFNEHEDLHPLTFRLTVTAVDAQIFAQELKKEVKIDINSFGLNIIGHEFFGILREAFDELIE